MFRILFCFVCLAVSSSVFAQDSGALDCIKNSAGNTVCGDEAEAFREKIRAEQRAANADASTYKTASSNRSRRGSSYSRFGNTIGLRGGYIFGSTGGGDGTYGALAYTRKINASDLAIKLDFELYGAVNTFGTDGIGGFISSVIWQYEDAPVQPFIGIGVGYANVSNVFGASAATFVYQGRAGFNIPIIPRIGIEAAYRYTGLTDFRTSVDLQGAELNLNINF